MILLRTYHKSSILYTKLKVTPDELSSVLKKRLRLNTEDLKQATTTEVDVNVPKFRKTSVHLKDDEGTAHSVFEQPTVDPKRFSIKKYTKAQDEIKQVIPLEKRSIPRLAPDLVKVLHKRKVHLISNDDELQKHSKGIMSLFDSEYLNNEFIPPSEDTNLLDLAIKEGKTYYSSTSSMTSALFQFYRLLNHYDPESSNRFRFKEFTKLMKKLPTSLIVRKKANNTYSISSDKSADYATVLSEFGHVAETMLTDPEFSPEEVETFEQEVEERLKEVQQEDPEEPEPEPEQGKEPTKVTTLPNVYNYSSYGKFLLRSQLDCYNETLPGNGTFDLKSRAISHIRHDIGNPDMNKMKYPNTLNSFGEFNDLVSTAALLKYSFQARIGQMDGIFVAYHNLSEFLGYRYFTLTDIDKVFFKNSPIASYIAEKQFKFSLKILTDLLDTIRKDLPTTDDFRIVLKSSQKEPYNFNFLTVHVVPLSKPDLKTLKYISNNFGEKGGDIESHKQYVENFNKTTAEKVLTYSISINNWVNDEKLGLQVLPASKDDKWVLEYRLSRLEPDATGYLSDLSIITGTMIKKSRVKKQTNPIEETGSSENQPAPNTKATISFLNSIVGKKKRSRHKSKESEE